MVFTLLIPQPLFREFHSSKMRTDISVLCTNVHVGDMKLVC